jgi:hypothetical protein
VPEEPPPVPSPDDFVGRMIPTGNKPALIAYYTSLAALVPGLGIVAGIVAVIFGVRGIRLARAHPEVRGGLHAWFGVILGGFFALVWIAGIALIVVASMAGH